MSTDPPTQEVKLLRHWITDLEVSAGRADPDSRFSARIYVDEELVCDLPWIDSAQSLQWSGLLCCDMSPTSEVAVRLCKSVKDKPRYFNYPPYTVSDVDEETGESALELRTAAWIITVRSLTPTMAEQTYPNEVEKFDAIEGTYDKLEPDATIKYLFKYSLRFASIIAEARPESTAKVSFLVYMKAWELLDQQTQFDDTVQAILRGLIWVGNIVDIINQASRSILADCIEQSKEPIKGILALLEDVSVYIFQRYTTGDLVRIPAGHEENQNGYDVETYSNRLEELQRSFFASWSPATTSGTNNIWTTDDDKPPLYDTDPAPTHGSQQL
ncbi:hypothetical protein BN14_06528 [Rhizoctonia solani AG-1 IB]|uniref:Uncharacterized protein n=1 Tax=Thanatephorus cucumeris (strain AG1-IB / isolate 7/3/14) TaxID=1108050 RepID=M5BXV7_THACB|nr:hypothetical protein BN14_06528 [Rhizoctonia solani AG-1 IB]